MKREEIISDSKLLSSSEFDSRLARTLEGQGACLSKARLLLIGFGGLDDLVGDLGTEATRAALRALGERIQGAIPQELCASRVFGDRFAVLVEGGASVERVAESLFRSLRTPVIFHGEKLTLRPRFGIAKAENASCAQDLLRRGTAALKRAESIGGRGPTLYQTQQMPLHATDPRLAQEIHDALDQGQITPWLQPLWSIETGEMIGAEALARWIHPERGVIPPSAFLPLAKRAGLLSRLDAAIRCHALAWLTRVRRDHTAARALTVSVNVADADLVDSSLPDQIQAELEHYGLPASSLCLELSERAETVKSPEIQGRIRKMADAGLRWHLDDFGTGQSNIQRLKGLPFRAVKLDRSMIGDLGRDAHTEQLLKPIVALARVLDLDVIAEGVERGDQLRALRQLGCDIAQGHHLSPPRPAEAIEALLKEKSAMKPTAPAELQVADRS